MNEPQALTSRLSSADAASFTLGGLTPYRFRVNRRTAAHGKMKTKIHAPSSETPGAKSHPLPISSDGVCGVGLAARSGVGGMKLGSQSAAGCATSPPVQPTVNAVVVG